MYVYVGLEWVDVHICKLEKGVYLVCVEVRISWKQ